MKCDQSVCAKIKDIFINIMRSEITSLDVLIKNLHSQKYTFILSKGLNLQIKS